jgi:hypothetical protein
LGTAGAALTLLLRALWGRWLQLLRRWLHLTLLLPRRLRWLYLSLLLLRRRRLLHLTWCWR